jgi:hypothetical protein
MAERPALEGGEGHGSAQTRADVLLEDLQLVFRQDEKERLEEQVGFPKAGVQIEMIGIHSAPEGIGGKA